MKLHTTFFLLFCLFTISFAGSLLSGAPLLLVNRTFGFTEGPAYNTLDQYLYFSDISATTIYRFYFANSSAMGSDVEAYVNNSEQANGLAFDQDGELLICQWDGGRRVVRLTGFQEGDALYENISVTYDGTMLNSPNDLAIKDDGRVYFTDPRPVDLTFAGVYRNQPGSTAADLISDNTTYNFPNGIAFSPDQSKLYVSDSNNNFIQAYDVEADGTLSNRTFFAPVAGPDGMAVDVEGNIYVTTNNASGSVIVFDSEGNVVDSVAIPVRPTNCGFGGPELKTLFVTARQSVYYVQGTVSGITAINDEETSSSDTDDGDGSETDTAGAADVAALINTAFWLPPIAPFA